MSRITLLVPNKTYQEEVMAYRQAFSNNAIDGGAMLEKFDDFSQWLDYLAQPEGYLTAWGFNKVQDSTYLAWHTQLHQVVGIINIRHNLNNDYLRQFGGYIGYSIHPDFRKQGYCSEMLKLALAKVKTLGLDKVLITCEESNVGSEKVILNNGGKFESIVELNQVKRMKRFWVEVL
ncbi:GNAT family N-acetyltransferase [Glaesserella parasuis]|nr:GNAT family N-acetyltransferase [Glaesserella parasuis]